MAKKSKKSRSKGKPNHEEADGVQPKKSAKMKSTSGKKSSGSINNIKRSEKNAESAKIDPEASKSQSPTTKSGSHKSVLANLESKDPEFFKFLKEQDADLLEFDLSDDEEDVIEEEDKSEVGESDDFEDKIESDDGEQSFEGDRSDDEEEMEGEKTEEFAISKDRDGRKIFNRNLLAHLESALAEDRPSPSSVRMAVHGFRACVARAGAKVEAAQYVIKDEQAFDSLVRLCFSRLGESLYALLVPIKTEVKTENEKWKVSGENDVTAVSNLGPKARFAKWRKYGNLAKIYLQDLVLFLNELQSADIILATLKAIAKMIDIYVIFSKLSKQLIKQLVRIWSRKTEDCRLGAFVAILKFVRCKPDMFAFLLKSCYLGFVSNARLVTSDTWPLLTLMHKSFAQLCTLQPNVAYQFAFIYIRQTAIHLRNAMIQKKKELVEAVYNWQFLQCLYLWARVIGTAAKTKTQEMQAIVELAYPLTQVVLGCANLVPTVKHYPLRLHCARILLRIQANCHIQIPVFPLLAEILAHPEQLSKRSVRQSSKPLELENLLKVSKATMEENGFKDAVMENLCNLLLETAYVNRATLAYSELVFHIVLKMKDFSKKCRVGNYCRQMKGLVEKFSEHAKFVDATRSKMAVDLTDPMSIHEIEYALRSSESPLAKYYASWKKLSALRSGELAKKYIKQEVKTEPSDETSKVQKQGKRKRKLKENAKVELKLKSVKKERLSPTFENDKDQLRELILSDSD